MVQASTGQALKIGQIRGLREICAAVKRKSWDEVYRDPVIRRVDSAWPNYPLVVRYQAQAIMHRKNDWAGRLRLIRGCVDYRDRSQEIWCDPRFATS
jgi:hypothetical protein